MAVSVNDIRIIDMQCEGREEKELCNFKFL